MSSQIILDQDQIKALDNIDEENRELPYEQWSENLTLIEQTLPNAFECTQQCYAGSWTGKDTWLRENVSKLLPIDLPFQNCEETHLDRYLKETMAHQISCQDPKMKSLLKMVKMSRYDHVLITWPKLRPELILPRKVALSDDGKPIMFQNEEKLIPMDIFNDPLTTKVVKWMSDKDHLDPLNSADKFIINSIKKFINKKTLAVFIHKDTQDACGVAAGLPHLHLVINRNHPGEAEEFLASHDYDLQLILKKVSKVSGDVTIQPVRHIVGLIGLLLNKPRLYLGSNENTLYSLTKAIKQGDITFQPLTAKDCLGEVDSLAKAFDKRLVEYNWSYESTQDSATVSTSGGNSTHESHSTPISISEDEGKDSDSDTIPYQIQTPDTKVGIH